MSEGQRQISANGLKVVDVVERLDLGLATLLDEPSHLLLNPPLAFELAQFLPETHLRLVELHLPTDVVLQLLVPDPSRLVQSPVLEIHLLLQVRQLTEALGHLVVNLHPQVVPKVSRLLIPHPFRPQLVFDQLQGSPKGPHCLERTTVFAGETSQVEVVDLKHAVLTPFQGLYLLKLMHLHQKTFQDILGIVVPVRPQFSSRLLLAQQLVRLLSLEFEKAVHEFVDSVGFDDEKLFVEDLVVLWVLEAEALGEVGGSFEEVVVAERSHAGLSHRLEVVHKD